MFGSDCVPLIFLKQNDLPRINTANWRTSMTRQVTQYCFTLLALALFAGNTVFSQEAIDAPQSWTGTLDVGAAKLRLRFDIEKDDAGGLKCTMVSIDQGNVKIPMDSCKIDAGMLVITSEKLKITYKGSYKNRNTPVEGKFTQSGRSFDLTLKAAKPAPPTKHIETWQGTMKAGGRSFEFQFRVLETKDKKRKVELDSFSEGIGGLNVDPTFKDDSVTFEVSITKARFEGKYNKDKTQIDGHWLQSGGKFPLTIKKVPLAKTRSIKPKR